MPTQAKGISAQDTIGMGMQEDKDKQARLWACGRGDASTPSFGSHLNPISTRGGRLCPPYTGVHTKF